MLGIYRVRVVNFDLSSKLSEEPRRIGKVER
jgi:hypothetical protein